MIANTYVLPFHLLLRQLMAEQNIRPEELVEFSQETEYPFKLRAIQRYRAGESVPSFLRAKIILNLLGVELSDEELTSSLLKSSDMKKDRELKEERKFLDKHIRIPLKDFNFVEEGENLELVNILISDRVKQLYGNDKSAFSYYLRDLIIKDIYENILTDEGGN